MIPAYPLFSRTPMLLASRHASSKLGRRTSVELASLFQAVSFLCL